MNNAVLPSKRGELKVEDSVFATIVEEINVAALNLRPTRSNNGLENFMKHVEHIVKSHGVNYGDYCSDVMLRKS